MTDPDTPMPRPHRGRTVIRGGTVVDPAAAFPREADVLVVDGAVAAVGEHLPGEAGDEVIDAAGLLVAPGLVDLHCHIPGAGDGDTETVATACRAAVRGGYTSLAVWPTGDVPADTEGQVGFVIRLAQRLGLARAYPVGSLTKQNAGGELAEMGMMAGRGALAFADLSATTPATMRKAMQYAKTFGALVMQSAEEPSLGGGVMHAGAVSTRLGLRGVPVEAETLVLGRDLTLNARVGGRYHAGSLSTAGAVDLLRAHGGGAADVSGDVAVANLLLTHEACAGFDPMTKLRPPLREEADREALIDGLRDGTLAAVSTGHRPCRPDEKDTVFQEAHDGASMLEAALPLAASALVEPGHLDWLGLVQRMSTNPAHVLRLTSGRGTLAEGSAADVVLIDPAAEHAVDPATFASRGKNTPFAGRRVRGRVVRTLVSGRTVWDAGL